MSHRRAGVGALQQQQRQKKLNFAKVASELEHDQLDQMKQTLSGFKERLELFATVHASEIRKNPSFRTYFQQLCLQVGVDPLASNKGFWTELLGFGDFYYELSVQIVQVCMESRALNGGFIEFGEAKRQVEAMRGKKSQLISE